MPVFLQQGEDWLQVGGLAKAAAGCLMGVATAELGAAGAGDPVQQPAGVIDAGVGAHEVEHRPGVVDQVVGQPDGGGEGVGADRLGLAVAQVTGQMQQACHPAGGAGGLGRPPGEMGQVAAVGGKSGFQVALEPQQ